jgi:hypothetical protein
MLYNQLASKPKPFQPQKSGYLHLIGTTVLAVVASFDFERAVSLLVMNPNCVSVALRILLASQERGKWAEERIIKGTQSRPSPNVPHVVGLNWSMEFKSIDQFTPVGSHGR